MHRPAALLIVMLLAGHPGLALACEVWCDMPAAETHHNAVGCHRAPHAESAARHGIAAAAACHGAIAVTAFLNEVRQPDTRPVPMASAVDHALAVLARRAVMGEGRPAFHVHASGAAASPTVLRI